MTLVVFPGTVQTGKYISVTPGSLYVIRTRSQVDTLIPEVLGLQFDSKVTFVRGRNGAKYILQHGRWRNNFFQKTTNSPVSPSPKICVPRTPDEMVISKMAKC